MNQPRRKSYRTDVSDEQWERIAPYIPEPRPGPQAILHTRRELVNAILYVTRTGVQWRNIPHDFPPWQTVYYYFRRWEREGVWKRLNDELRRQIRRHCGRDEEPTAAIIDSQSVKTALGGPRGYDAAKKISGRKRFALVDTLGLLLAICIVPASVQDRDGSAELIRKTPLPSTLQVVAADQAHNVTHQRRRDALGPVIC